MSETLDPAPGADASGLPADDRVVSMSNRLARSAHGLNLSEKRLVALGLAQSEISTATKSLPRNAGLRMVITARDYADSFGLDTTTAYEQLKHAADKLFERYVKYPVPGRRGKVEEKKFRWVSGCHYAPGEGFVELNFSPEIAPHLVGLTKQLTRYKLRQAASFDTVYAWRLFELLRSYETEGELRIEIEEFWDIMEAPKSAKEDFKVLRVRIIEPSVAALASKAAMIVEWTPIRSGSRRVCALHFRFHPDPQGRLDIDVDVPGQPAALAAPDQ